MVGAIGMVCYGGPVDAPAQQFGHPGFGLFEAALACLDGYLSRTAGDELYTAYEFNDARDRTVVDVLHALIAAADAHDIERPDTAAHPDTAARLGGAE
jgi:hypothetical protein